MNAKNRRLLVTGGALGLLLGLTFGGLTFANGPVLLHADRSPIDPNRGPATVANMFSRSRTDGELREARQVEMVISAIVIIAAAVAVTYGTALSGHAPEGPNE